MVPSAREQRLEREARIRRGRAKCALLNDWAHKCLADMPGYAKGCRLEHRGGRIWKLTYCGLKEKGFEVLHDSVEFVLFEEHGPAPYLMQAQVRDEFLRLLNRPERPRV